MTDLNFNFGRVALIGFVFVFVASCASGDADRRGSKKDVDTHLDGGFDDVDPGDADAGPVPDTDIGTDPDADTDTRTDPCDACRDDQVCIDDECVGATILQSGTQGLLLRGIVLTPEGVLDPGEVLVEGAFITCVAEDCTGAVGAAQATWIDTNGIISPGLIDAHNHLPYNFLPEWTPDPFRHFNNRYIWADEEAYEDHVRPYAKRRSTGTHYCPAGKWGELRSLIHATTTIQGQSFQQGCVNWGIRNADHYHGLGHNHMRTAIGSPRDFNDADAASYIASFEDPVNPTTRFAVHMTEGVSGNNIELEFDSFDGHDTRPNRHAGVSLLEHGAAILIHAMALTEDQLLRTYYTDSKIVWSPSSNMVLYGVTAPIQRILEIGIVTGLGPDWTVSGAPDMLAEMRFARDYAETANIDIVTPRRLWEMATFDGAEVVGLGQHLGRIEVGFRADIAVFGRRHDNPYSAVIESRTQDVRLVLLDGKAHYGDANLAEATRVNEYCEPFDACGVSKFICVQESPTATARKNETLDDIRTQLYNILEGMSDFECSADNECPERQSCFLDVGRCGYPVDEHYGRGSDLLELALCDR